MDVKLQVTLVILCTLALCDLGSGGHRKRGPSNGLRMPNRHRLMTWSTFTEKVTSRMWNQIYLLPIQNTFPVFLRLRSWPQVTDDDVHIPFHVRDGNGDCKTQDDFSLAVDFTHAPGENYAILRSGTQENRYFTSDADSYMFVVQCFDVSTIVKGVCTGEGLLFLSTSQFPPNQLNWWRILWDLRRYMGISFLDPRWRFVAAAEGCW